MIRHVPHARKLLIEVDDQTRTDVWVVHAFAIPEAPTCCFDGFKGAVVANGVRRLPVAVEEDETLEIRTCVLEVDGVQ